ncbi:hypothetical protein [Frankia sp. AgB32]|uniref:hypothetical protein n=1 Tax=Frankia sp. AgB32 TaxID=631119 RepID=UPI00200D3AA6|nr:hypothetical protein [Frankia sp. AgB32]MCK9895565.1 hypothetical protein [Frankia sp. AgB32]
MDDDVRALLETISELLPPRTTVYRSSAATSAEGCPLVEPVTEPIPLPVALPAS